MTEFGSEFGLAIQTDPWAISFGVLEQSSPLGFSCEARAPAGAARVSTDDPAPCRWSTVTRARHETRRAERYSVVLDTDDVRAPTAEVDVRFGEGRITVSIAVDGAAVISQSFVARTHERFLGFGERSHAFGLDRGVVENYVGDGPFQPHEYPLLTDTVPPWAIRNRPDATYFPVPWVLSSRGYGVSIDNDELSYIRLRVDASDRWSIEVEAEYLAFTVYDGPSPLEALGRYSASVGRQPAPERWFFGPWYQSGHANHVPLDEEKRQLDALDGAAASVVETHCRYLPLGEDRGHEDDERARTAFFHSRGLAVLSYINPLVGQEYADAFEPAVEAGAVQRDQQGRPYVFRAYAGGRVPPHTPETQYDFGSPGAAACWGAVAERIVAAGYDGWMEDFGEYTPLDAVAADGSTGTAAHNRYPTEYHRAAAAVAGDLERRYERRLARFVRSGWAGTAPFVPIVWGGDPTTTWGFNGLASALTEGLSLGASGVAMWGSDIGGFMSTLDRLTPELLRRWIQFAAFCPVMRTKAGGIEIPAYERPQIWDTDVLPTWRRWSRWHTRLNDYLMAAHDMYRSTGRPIMCALELAFPDIGPVPDQYLLGEHLLVAPVKEPGCTSRRVVLPPGRWCDLFEPGRWLTGPAVVDVAVGPDDIPVFVRDGAVLALLPEDVDSLSPYAPVLEDRRDVHAFVGAGPRRWAGALGPGLWCRSETGTGSWTLELSAPRSFTWNLTAAVPGRPVAAEIDGPWSFESGMLTCSLRGASAALRLRWDT
jgi:sulfoquinovosidase